MEYLRTPDSAFANLPGYDFEPHYIEINGARVHYLDEGSGEVILCLHGEPTWSYLYRKFFPILTPHYRLIAPDLIGFGKSDKLPEVTDYSFKLHFEMILEFIDKLQLNNITIVVQDWGGLLGLAAVGRVPEKFARVVILNTYLPIGDRPMPMAFKLWRAFAKNVPNLPVGFIINRATHQKLSKEILSAYQAPFPSKKYKAGTKAFPILVPDSPNSEGVPEMKQARKVLGNWQKPALLLFSDKDPIFSKAVHFFRKLIPTAKDQPEITIKDASHFLQEDKGEEIAAHIKDFMDRTATV